MKKRKTYEISVINKTYSREIHDENYSRTHSDETKFYTSDTALELAFELKETEYNFESAEIVLLNVDDRSLATRPVSKTNDGFVYEIDDDITTHYGDWRGQLMLVENGEVHVSSPIKFRIENDLYCNKPLEIIEVVSWVSLKRYADSLVDELKQAVLDVEGMDDTFKANELERQATFENNEASRFETFNTNEATRQSNETTRQQGESGRVEAEKQRNETVNNIEARQNSVETQFNSIQQEMTDKDPISAPEIIAARGGEPTLNARLDKEQQEVNAQLDQTVKKIPNIANASTTLKILNPYGNYQNIHPKVLHFPDGLFGYKWWCAYTPYPGGNTTQENPCLAVSNNGIDWGVPAGFANEVLDDWNGVVNAYNNDTHMVYRSDLKRLEIWWRFADTNTKIISLHRRTSTDGINWTPKETLFTGTQDFDDHLSPAVVFEDNKYKMLSVSTKVGGKRYLSYVESADAKNWSTRFETYAEWDTLTPWHLDFINDGGKYKMVMQAWDIGKTSNTSNLYYMESDDMLNWSKPTEVISPNPLENAFDNQGIYRSSIVKVDGMYYVFYSAVSKSNQRAMALSYSKKPTALKGYNADNSLIQLEESRDLTNVVDVKQKTNSSRFGSVKVGNLLFANGTTDGVAPEQFGALRWVESVDVHQRYSKSKDAWVALVPHSSKRLLAEKTVEQNLVSGSYITVSYESKKFEDGNFFTNDTTFVTPESGMYRFDIGLYLTGLQANDDVHVYLQRSGADFRPLLRQKVVPESAGIFYVNSSITCDLVTGYQMSIAVKYTGVGAAKISRYPSQNFLFVERL